MRLKNIKIEVNNKYKIGGEIMIKREIIGAGMLLGASVVVTVVVSKMMKKHNKAKKEDSFQKDCIYLAALDDEICRREWNGKKINGDVINFPPKKESLYYRYQLFAELYAGYSEKQREKEIKKFEQRLYKNKLNQNKK